jgi:hypothetical protein
MTAGMVALAPTTPALATHGVEAAPMLLVMVMVVVEAEVMAAMRHVACEYNGFYMHHIFNQLFHVLTPFIVASKPATLLETALTSPREVVLPANASTAVK